MAEGEEFVLIDVRPSEEYQRYHIIGSLNTQLDSITQNILEKNQVSTEKMVAILVQMELSQDDSLEKALKPVADRGYSIKIVEGGIDGLKDAVRSQGYSISLQLPSSPIKSNTTLN